MEENKELNFRIMVTSPDILEKEIKTLISERFKGKREKENVEIISREDFLKELQVIVTAYENIYNDNEVREMFEKYKQKF